jgi:hypothetical protein
MDIITDLIYDDIFTFVAKLVHNHDRDDMKLFIERHVKKQFGFDVDVSFFLRVVATCWITIDGIRFKTSYGKIDK